jgi:hypothetical protein
MKIMRHDVDEDDIKLSVIVGFATLIYVIIEIVVI